MTLSIIFSICGGVPKVHCVIFQESMVRSISKGLHEKGAVIIHVVCDLGKT